jgi:DNA repair protein RAD50
MKSSNYEEKLAEKISKGRNMEDRRDTLNTELRRLGLQADARAKLDLKRTEFRTKTADVKNTCVFRHILYKLLHALRFAIVSKRSTRSSVN